MEIIKQPGGCIKITHAVEEINRPYLLISDVHFDNPKCNRKLLKQHLDEAVERNAGILCFGDFFDAMQGRNDRRANKSDLGNEYKVANYLDSLVDNAAAFLEPYKNNLVMFSNGNHETSVVQKLETDLIYRLVQQLDSPTFFHGAYQGFIKFQFMVRNSSMRTKVMFYHHGGFHGVITKGTLSIGRYASIAPDADIIVSGDSHDKWTSEHPQYRLTQNGSTKVVPQLHIKCATYKEEFSKNDGWAVEKIIFPKSMGGWWLTFHVEHDDIVARVAMT